MSFIVGGLGIFLSLTNEKRELPDSTIRSVSLFLFVVATYIAFRATKTNK